MRYFLSKGKTVRGGDARGCREAVYEGIVVAANISRYSGSNS
jgi:hypothetical protein